MLPLWAVLALAVWVVLAAPAVVSAEAGEVARRAEPQLRAARPEAEEEEVVMRTWQVTEAVLAAREADSAKVVVLVAEMAEPAVPRWKARTHHKTARRASGMHHNSRSGRFLPDSWCAA